MNPTASLLTKTDQHTNKEVYAVEFRHGADGRLLRTSWTTIREEACAWGRNIQQTGWSTEGRPGPVV
jgi:hypothetical protein